MPGQIIQSRPATFGPFTITTVEYEPGGHPRAADNFGHPWRAARAYFLTTGEARIKCGADVRAVAPRGAAVAVGWEPSELHTPGASALEVDVAVERTDLVEQLAPLTVAAWPGDAALPGATAAALNSFAAHPPTAEAARSAARFVIEALIGSLLSLPGTTSTDLKDGAAPSSSSGKIGTTPKLSPTAVTAYIKRRYANHDFGPDQIAEHFGVSLRTVQRLLPPGESLSAALAEVRLRAALRKLADPVLADVPLTDLAYSCGYGSEIAMRRAVLAATGATPSQLRAAGSGG